MLFLQFYLFGLDSLYEMANKFVVNISQTIEMQNWEVSNNQLQLESLQKYVVLCYVSDFLSSIWKMVVAYPYNRSVVQELLRHDSNKSRGGVSVVIVIIFGLLGIILGYTLKRT